MPNRHRHRSCRSRRRPLALLLLVPVAGCALPSWTSRLPLFPEKASQQPAEDEGRVATTDPSPFQTAAFRQQALVDSESLISTADAIMAAAGAAEETPQLPQPVADPVPDAAVSQTPELPPPTRLPEDSPQIIDLASALGMAGGNAWTIHLARQRTVEAHAELKEAKALWLPTLQFGVGWNNHAGRIQATDGQVLEVSRNSLFVGGGATLGQSPLAGGSGGPIRLFADLALADAFFQPKIARRQVSARKAGVVTAKNQALLDAGLAYVDLLEAAGQVADSQAAIAAAEELVQLTSAFAEAGAGAQADVDRAATEQARLTQQLHNAHRLLRTRSANLSRRLRLDPRFALHPADQVMVPIELSSDSAEINSLIGTALAQRPEINGLSHEIASLCHEVRRAEVDPFLPKVAVVGNAGNFGGAQGSTLDNQASRSDVDLLAVWELDSLGLGIVADRSGAQSRLEQRKIELADLRDQITADVVAAHENVLNYRTQIDSANQALELAEASYERNLQRVRADEGLPIELLQAINAKVGGLRDRTDAVAGYNRAQLQLLHATGQLTQ